MSEQILSQDEVEASSRRLKTTTFKPAVEPVKPAAADRLRQDAEAIDLTSADRTATVRMPVLRSSPSARILPSGRLESTIRAPWCPS